MKHKNAIMYTPAFAHALCLLLLASGCTSGRTRLSVGNVSEGPILNIKVHTENSELMYTPRLAMQASSRPVRLTAPPSGEATVEWTHADGRTLTQTVAAPEPLPTTFRGTLYIEIGRNEQARLFVVPHTRDGRQDIPWARPESWEGYPGIPGMTHD